MNILIIYTIILTFGIAIGSFLNVVIYRLPRDIKIRTGRSACPHCKQQLKWFHNVPLVSYLMLGRKCSFCKETISIRYPLVELINGLLFVYLYWQFGFTPAFPTYAFICSSLVVIFLIDLDFQIIPDSLTLPGLGLGLIVSMLPGGIGISASGIGLLVGGGSLYAVAMLGDFLFKKDSMGGGDIKMAAMLGAFLGWQKVLFIFISSAFIGLIVSIVLMMVSAKIRSERVVPFGPFLAVAGLIAIVYGDEIIGYYIDHFLRV